MPASDACLLDGNILLRISKLDDPQNVVINHALHTLVGQGVRLCYTSRVGTPAPQFSRFSLPGNEQLEIGI